MSDRVTTIREEMAGAVRAIGGDGVMAKVANHRAAVATGLPIGTIECLRYRKIKRIPADIADAVRAAFSKHEKSIERKARHEAEVLRQTLAPFANIDGTNASASWGEVCSYRISYCALDRPDDAGSNT